MLQKQDLRTWMRRHEDAEKAHELAAPVEVGYPTEQVVRRRTADLTSRELGELGERVAADYLVQHGMQVLERNWTNPFGEVDIVARDEDGTCVLVEVKTRRVACDGEDRLPELAVGRKKRDRYRKMGLYYLADSMRTDSVRFDVIAINISPQRAMLRHVIGAFAWEQ